jgi:hypothetical protein
MAAYQITIETVTPRILAAVHKARARGSGRDGVQAGSRQGLGVPPASIPAFESKGTMSFSTITNRPR